MIVRQLQRLLALLICYFYCGHALGAIAFEDSVTSRGNDDRGSVTVPAGTDEDDLLLAQVSIRNRSGSDGVTTPAGWTLIDSQLRDSDVLQSIYYRVATAGDAGASYEWDFDGNGNRRYIIGLSVFSGVDASDPIEDSSGQTNMSGSTVTAPGVTTAMANSYLVTFFALEAGNHSFTPPAGFNEIYDVEENNNSNGVTAMASYQDQAVAGFSGAKTATASKSGDDAIGQMVALNVGNTVATELSAWYLDELSWDGVSADVIDSGVGGHDGIARNGASTAYVNPVVSGSPGTCYYGVFDDAGSTTGNYIELSSFPNLTADFSVAAWFRTSDNTRSGQRIFADDQNNTQGYAISLGDPGTGRLRFYSRGVSPVSMDTGNIISNDTWYFVVGLADITNRERTLLVYNTAGTLINTTNASYTGTWGSDAGPASIGGETNSGETANRFFGNLDEVRIYNGLLNSTQIAALISETRTCGNGIPPTISTVVGSCVNMEEVTIQFSEDVDPTTAQDVSNYQLTNPSGAAITINSATLTSGDTVVLDAAVTLNDLTEYTVTINDVEDLFGDIIAANSTGSFTLGCNTNCISDSFAGPGPLSSSWSVNNSSGSFGDPRIVNNGFLRLTDASGNVATVATLLNQFPGADNKVVIEFDYYAYSGSGADGIAVTLSDASVTPVPGSYGGALGYAQRSGGNPGFAGGWLGVGLDEYGNFANPNEGKSGGSGFERDSVALRGSGSGTTGYPYLTSTGTLSPGIDQSGSTRNPGHRYRITVDHTMGGASADVTVERDTGSGYTDIVPQFDIFAVNPSQAAVPTNWVISFTGSTGGATNIHEIGDFQVCAAQPIGAFNLVDHYQISHSGTGVTCEASAVTITARDASNNPVTVASNTSLTVTTSPTVDSIISTPATINAGDSSTTIYLNQSSALANIDIDVTDGTATDVDDGGVDDPPISFLDTAFRFYADGDNIDTTPIGTQIAGKANTEDPDSQTLTLRAVRTNTDTGACEAALTGTQTVQIAYECNNPSTCSGSNLLSFSSDNTDTISRNNNGASLSYTTVDMTFDGSGEASFSFNFSDAGQITLHASKSVAASSPEPAFTLTGSSNPFVVRPFALDIDFADQRSDDWADDGVINDSRGTNTSFAQSATGTVFGTAGMDFTANIEAMLWQAADDTNNDGIPDAGANVTNNGVTPNFGQETSASSVTLSHSLDSSMPGGAQLGTFSHSAINVGGGSSSFSAGAASSTLNWSEVGIIDLTASLSNYLGDTNADVSGNVADVGRFVPANFAVSANAGSFLNAGSGYTYIGQDFGYLVTPTLTITAQNASGATTQNYTLSGYQKLVSGDISPNVTFPSADSLTNGSDGATAMAVSSSTSGGSLPSVNAASGVMTYSFDVADSFSYDKDGNSEVIPFDSSLQLGVGIFTDSDSIASNSTPNFTPGAANLRYGRWQMENVFGPETMSLSMDAFVAFLNSSGDYVINTLDSDSSIAGTVTSTPAGTAGTGTITGIAVGGGTSDLTFGTTLNNGDGQFSFSNPGAGNTGTIDIDVDLSGLPWLRYDWDGAGGLEDHPGASATFGRYRGHDRIIYWREL